MFFFYLCSACFGNLNQAAILASRPLLQPLAAVATHISCASLPLLAVARYVKFTAENVLA